MVLTGSVQTGKGERTMPDREKVIKGLECHRIDNNHRINCADCPYYVDDDNHIRCVNDLHDDALELLKEQEAVEPIKPLDKDDDYTFMCSNCKGELFCGDVIRDNFCPTCGRSVKWE